MLETIGIMRDISRRCLSNEPLTATQSRWLGASLTNFLDHRSPSLHEAFGLRFPKGGVSWWMEEAIRKRNAALRNLAEHHFYDLPASVQAERIATLANRYATSAWRHDCTRGAMPPHYRGTSKEHLWKAFASEAAMPLCRRQLSNILAR